MFTYPVALITFGIGNDNADVVCAELKTSGFVGDDDWKDRVVDLRKYLQDPKRDVSKVGWQIDGTHESTQRAVLSQSSVVNVLQWIVNDFDWAIHEELPMANVKAIHCTTGCHRADTIGRMSKEMLNRIMQTDEYGRTSRMFNCQHFPLCHVQKRDVKSHMKMVSEWIDNPHTLVKGGMSIDRENLYGHDASQSRKEATTNWTAVFDWVETWESRYDQVRPDIADALDDLDELEEIGQPKDDSVEEELVENDKVEYEHVEDEPVEKPTKKHRTSYQPEWATDVPDVKLWYPMLKDMKFDDDALADLFLLSQHSEDGYKAANGLVHRILKHKQDRIPMRKPSAWLHSSVKASRWKLD